MAGDHYVNKLAQQNGDHEVHVSGCKHMPLEHNRKYLGYFLNCRDAVAEARKDYTRVNGCYHCSRECHTS